MMSVSFVKEAIIASVTAAIVIPLLWLMGAAVVPSRDTHECMKTRMRCTAPEGPHTAPDARFCYFTNENSAVCVVPSASRTVSVPHFPAHDFSVFHT